MNTRVRQLQHARIDGLHVRDQRGFTMVELMVVVLVIGILMAVAIPTFLGSRTRAQNRAAQSDLRNALVGAKAIFSSNGTYRCARATNGAAAPCVGIGLPSVEPSLLYQTTASTVALPRVSVNAYAVATEMTWAAARMSKSGTCYGIRDVATPTGVPPNPATVGTWYGQGTALMGTCTGAYAGTGTTHTPNRKWT